MSTRLRVATVLVALSAACGSFGTSEGSFSDAGDGGSGGDGGPEAGLPSADAGARVYANKRCLDFEKTGERAPPFGFDRLVQEVDGGLGLADGFQSTASLRARAVKGVGDSYGEIGLQPLPTDVRVTLRVRGDARSDVGGSSAHFFVLACSGGTGDSLIAKLTFDGELSVQAGSDGTPLGRYTIAEWIAVEALAHFEPASHSIELTRVGTTERGRKVSNTPCEGPLRVRLGSLVHGSSPSELTLSLDDVCIEWN